VPHVQADKGWEDVVRACNERIICVGTLTRFDALQTGQLMNGAEYLVITEV
jgi:hypothetical protein